MSITGNSLDELIEILEDIYEVLFIGGNIASLGISGIVFLIGILSALFAFLFSVLVYVLEAIPVFRLGWKMGRTSAWLAWIPVFGSYFRTYILCDIPGKKSVALLKDKLMIKSRAASFGIYLLILLGGNTLITLMITILGVIPVIGQIIAPLTTLLYLLPAVVCAYMEYIYLKDVLNLFKDNKKSNIIASIIVTLLDTFVTFGIARTVFLYTLWNREPIPTETVDSL